MSVTRVREGKERERDVHYQIAYYHVTGHARILQICPL